MHIRVTQDCYAVADPNRVGTWIKLVRATAYACRFVQRKKTPEMVPTREELIEAEQQLFREAQITFQGEINLLKQGKQHLIGRTSELRNVDLFLDNK